MFKKKERRCKTCNRIIVGESKTGICPECARKGKNELVIVLGSIALLVITRGKKK